jgi:protein tyrosine/serine phosphatase
MYVHCKGGKHRTGVTGAVYRFTKYGWDYDKVMKEMENYDFYTSFGHKAMKDFVVDYAAKLKKSPVTVTAVTAGVKTN